MKYPRVAPLVGMVAAAMVLAACGGSDSNDNSSNTTSNTGSNTGGSTTVNTGTANSVAAVKSAMTGANDGTSAELTSTSTLLNGPFVSAATAPSTAVAVGGYGQVFTASDNSATNTRVNLRNLETYARVGGKWTRLQFSGNVKGAFYSAGYAGAPTACDLSAAAGSCLRAESDGGVSFKPVAGKFFRFWPEAAFSQSVVDITKIEALFTTVQARLVKDAGSGADDRANAKYLVNTAATWTTSAWTSAATSAGSTGAYASTLTDVGQGRLTLATNDWAAVNFHSATTETMVDELGSPVSGGAAPLTNSQRTDDDDVVRIMFIGDSITQGSTNKGTGATATAAQDSFRRVLWNSLMTDASFPMVDFVGTRLGTSMHDNNACGLNNETADDGTYKLPEFDTDHFGFWGACVDQVNTALTPALASLDSDALRKEPDVAVVHIGTNNLHNNRGVDSVITQLTALIAALRAANDDITILVAQVVPFLVSTGGEADPRVATLNSAIAAQIAPLSTDKSKVIIVNQNEGFATTLLYDQFHPNDAGEKVIADKWLAALKSNNLLVDAD
ncbi:MAG: GDSL-type esterase/lipase family protein [Lautropia sp.]|nr:GDSL-type esterase/lipase family protein [Lautropia sp.]